MRILALTNLYPPHFLGGYELICETVVGELRRRGHIVQILTSDHRVPGVPNGEEKGIERSLRVHGFYGHPWFGIVKLRHLERQNNDILKEALARFKPDLVYVWNMGGLSKSMLLTLQATGLPSVFYMSDHWIARGLAADVWINWWNRADSSLKQSLMRGAATAFGIRKKWQGIAPTNPLRHFRFPRIYFCSRALRQLTASAGFDVMHGGVIYCPVNVEKFSGAPRPASRPLKKLLYAGRLAEDKGVMTALRAMKIARDKFEGTLGVYGRGDAEYVEKLHRFVKEHALPVQFGTVGSDEIPVIYREHDGLLFTSEWPEPFALTPLEAMATGLPVIGTVTGGSRELFRHRENALTYTAGNAEELAERIVEMANDVELRAALSKTGYDEVRANYTAPRIVDQIEDYLQESVKTWKPIPLPDYDA